ncbi:hypothetical protein KUCAC02_023214, partial [Chaenocephalus aceratus]
SSSVHVAVCQASVDVANSSTVEVVQAQFKKRKNLHQPRKCCSAAEPVHMRRWSSLFLWSVFDPSLSSFPTIHPPGADKACPSNKNAAAAFQGQA